MLNYNLVGDNDYIFDPIGTIFSNRGINDAEEFLNLDKNSIHHYSLLKNIHKAVRCLLKHIERKSEILIVVDPDVDGFTSAAIIYQYIKLIDENANLNWILHDDKKHGLDGIELPESINLLIMPDSGSEDYEEHAKLHKKNIDIIVLDHHEAEIESTHAIVVNPQNCDYPNRNLSGAGVVLKFCEALDDKLQMESSSQFYDLVALGNIADSMLMSEKETMYYVQEGLKDINNDFFNALVRKQSYSLNGNMNINSVSFFISPLINAVIRISSMEEKMDMFKSFLGVKELVNYKPRGKDEILVPLVDDMARRCGNARAKQNRIRDKIVAEIEEIIKINGLSNNKVIFISDLTIEEKGLSGLVANVIAGKYKRPAIILSGIDEDEYATGSGRGYDQGGIENFKNIVQNTNLFEYAKGHAGAFGVKIHKDKFDKVNTSLNELLGWYNIEDQYNVDFEIKASALNRSFIKTISELKDLWGKGIEEPLLAVKELSIKDSKTSIYGKKEDTISITHNGIKYILFKSDEKTMNDIKNAKEIVVIGIGSLNVYKGVTTPQVEIAALEIIK